jgi:hypothetical protein
MKRYLFPFIVFTFVLVLFLTKISNTTFAATRYESESNNTYSTANAINDDDNAYGVISSSTDLDFYKVQFSSSGKANFYLGDIPSGCDYDLQLLDSNGTTVLSSSTNGGNTAELISQYQVSANKWYYLKVYSYSGSNTSSYYLLRAKNYPTTLSGDKYEPNNATTAATSISSNAIITDANIHATSDNDYFMFTVSATSSVTIQLSNIPSGCDYDLELYDSSNTRKANSTAGSNNPESIAISLTSGTYYIKIYSYQGSSTSFYRLQVNSQVAVTGDRYESNNTTTAATSISSSATITDANIHATSDIDYFKFTLSAYSSVTIQLSNIPGGCDYDLELYDSGNTSRARSTAGDNSPENISLSLASGTYFIKVYSYSGSSNSYYRLQVTSISTGYLNISPLLFVGIGYDPTHVSTNPYPRYSDSDLLQIINSPSSLGTQEFVILGGDAGYGFTECITQTDIDSISTQGSTVYNYLGKTDSDALTTFSAGVKTLYTTLIKTQSSRTLDNFAQAQVELATRIWAINSNVKIWFSLPYIPDAGIFFAYKFNDPFKQLIDNIKSRVSSTAWSNNVIGFYYGTESVTQWYTKFDVSNTVDFNNPVVNNMNAVSSYVHGYGKKFLWIPYYMDGTDTSTSDLPRRLAWVSCTKNIFDYVDLQPRYYFHSTLTNNLNLVRSCVLNNTIVDKNGNPIIVSKTSNTQIGVEMEIDLNYSKDSGWFSRYNQYEDNFSGFRGTKHISFYCGDRDSLMDGSVYNKVKSFCNR